MGQTRFISSNAPGGNIETALIDNIRSRVCVTHSARLREGIIAMFSDITCTKTDTNLLGPRTVDPGLGTLSPDEYCM
jgi:hypothetical protein